MLKHALLLLYMLLLGGCGTSLLPPRAPLPASVAYDFGAFPADPPAQLTGPAVVLRQVTAPAWISDTQIHYRLTNDDPRQLRSYAASHWAGTPPDLVAERVAHALAQAQAGAAPAARHYALYIDMPVFEQDFSSTSAATVAVELHAVLRDPVSGEALAERSFSATAVADASARGAVDGLAQTVDKLTLQLLDWLAAGQADRH